MLYRARGWKTIAVAEALISAFCLMVAAGLAVYAPWSAWPRILLFGGPVVILITVARIKSDIASWNYEIEGSDLVTPANRNRLVIPISSIVRIEPTDGSTRLWMGDKLRVHCEPEMPFLPLVVDPEDRDAFLRGLVEADPGLRRDGEDTLRRAA